MICSHGGSSKVGQQRLCAVLLALIVEVIAEFGCDYMFEESRIRVASLWSPYQDSKTGRLTLWLRDTSCKVSF